MYSEGADRNLVLAGLFLCLLWNSSLSRAADAPVIEQIVTVASKRMIGPVEQFEVNETRLLKLSNDSVVVSFIDNSHNTVLRILAELCTRDQQTSIFDATVLRPNETAREFFEHNEEFRLDGVDEYLSYLGCMKAGTELEELVPSEGSASASGKQVRSSTRAVTQMNLWARFFGYQKDLFKAREFFVFSLEKQTEAIVNLSRGSNMKDLERLLGLFESSQPFELFTLDLPYANSDRMTLERYLKTVIYAREKLAIFYPAQKQLLNRDRDLLKTLGSQ
jgi:hypothetical protein